MRKNEAIGKGGRGTSLENQLQSTTLMKTRFFFLFFNSVKNTSLMYPQKKKRKESKTLKSN